MKVYKETKKTRLGVKKKVFVRKGSVYIPNPNKLKHDIPISTPKFFM